MFRKVFTSIYEAIGHPEKEGVFDAVTGGVNDRHQKK